MISISQASSSTALRDQVFSIILLSKKSRLTRHLLLSRLLFSLPPPKPNVGHKRKSRKSERRGERVWISTKLPQRQRSPHQLRTKWMSTKNPKTRKSPRKRKTIARKKLAQPRKSPR